MKIKVIQAAMVMSVTAAILGAGGCKSSTQNERSTGEKWDDKGVVRNVKKELKHNSLTKNADIEVNSFRGNVSLTGFVDYPEQKREAVALARSAEGVEWVKDDLIVKDTLPTQRGGMAHEAAGAQKQH